MKVLLNFYKCQTTLLLLMLVFLPSLAFPGDIVLVASEDTSITEHPQAGGPDSTHGSDIILQANGMATFRGFPMVRFDLSSLSGSVVSGDAVFSIYVRDIHPKNASVQKNIALYTWNSLDWDENTVNFSQVQFPPGPESLPSDLTLPKLATATVDNSNTKANISFTIPRAVIQAWIDDAASNRGFFLANEQTGVAHDVVFNAVGSAKGTEPTLSFTTN